MKVAIIGNGWVGKAMQDLFPNALTYVRDMTGLDENKYTAHKERINQADVAFICVPTPNEIISVEEAVMNENWQGEGKLDTSAVEECIAWLETPLIVVRSTVNPGDCAKWQERYMKQIVFQPEYLGETPEHPLLDTKKTPFIILGGVPDACKLVIDLYTSVYNANISIRQVSLTQAEIIKLSENRAIAFKVAQCQELYDVCEKAGVDYYTIRDAVYGDDPRFNLWWTFVYPDKRGFNSKCIPKDIYAWCAYAESLGYEPKITRALLEKNKEWIGGDQT
jgi:UDPglucose 6-dehydrogenase